jgi:hypothetical protein
MIVSASSEPSNNDTVAGLVFLAFILAVGYFGYRYFFPSDRAEVAACISAMMEASRGTFDYGSFGRALEQVQSADEVTITHINRTPFDAGEMIDMTYTVDGQRAGIVCAR